MPISLLLAGGLLLWAPRAGAQNDSSGIYRTVQDFQDRKLSYAINYTTEQHNINSHVWFQSDKLIVKHQGKKYILRKSNTYGYKNTSGSVFRFVGDKELKVLNPEDALLIYVYRRPAASPREADKYPPLYYFSTDAAAVPQLLTKINLKRAFPDQHRFHDGLDENFRGDADLIAYDAFHKMYKVYWIYKHYR